LISNDEVQFLDKEQLHKLHLHWVGTIQREGLNLTDWEVNFVLSIKNQLLQGRTLSPKQIEILEKIYTDKTP